MNAGEGAHAEFAQVIPLTVRWLERAVIGLNLCPFAKSVHVKGQVHYAVTHAEHREDLLADLTTEIEGILAQPPSARDTTLLIAPRAFPDFWDFNAFMPECDRLLKRLKLQVFCRLLTSIRSFNLWGQMRTISPTTPTARLTPFCISCARTALTVRCKPLQIPATFLRRILRRSKPWDIQGGPRLA